MMNLDDACDLYKEMLERYPEYRKYKGSMNIYKWMNFQKSFKLAESEYERMVENPFTKQKETKFDIAWKQLEREDL